MVCAPSIVHGMAAAGGFRNTLYYDQYHTAVLPDKSQLTEVTHVITAFANSSLFASDPPGDYQPFKPLDEIRTLFNPWTLVCMGIGGWGDTEGFRLGLADDASRARYAKNIADTLKKLGYNCVDIDLEYPGGNGYDYRQVTNDKLVSEIQTYPKLLSAIKEAIGIAELSISVPGLERDMIAFTPETGPLIAQSVDAVNVMSYDLINRRDTASHHHSDVKGSLKAIQAYLDRGFPAAKLNLGLAFYAKYFTLAANTSCDKAIGCPLALAEDAQGKDTGVSGAVTFEASSFPVEVDPSKIVPSTDGSCGATKQNTFYKCTGPATSGACCSTYNFCGDTPQHCTTGCQSQFGTCSGPATKSTARSFADALAHGTLDADNGGQWWVDNDAKLFWTWDTPALVAQKFKDIIAAKGLGGVFAWSLAEDSKDWALLNAMQDGVKAHKAAKPTRRVRRTHN